MTTVIDRFHDVDKYVPGGSVACASCKHYRGGRKCAAFPDGIPQPILDGKNDHRQPYDGDHSIQYVPAT
jgi:hypothetical protein